MMTFAKAAILLLGLGILVHQCEAACVDKGSAGVWCAVPSTAGEWSRQSDGMRWSATHKADSALWYDAKTGGNAAVSTSFDGKKVCKSKLTGAQVEDDPSCEVDGVLACKNVTGGRKLGGGGHKHHDPYYQCQKEFCRSGSNKQKCPCMCQCRRHGRKGGKGRKDKGGNSCTYAFLGIAVGVIVLLALLRGCFKCYKCEKEGREQSNRIKAIERAHEVAANKNTSIMPVSIVTAKGVPVDIVQAVPAQELHVVLADARLTTIDAGKS